MRVDRLNRLWNFVVNVRLGGSAWWQDQCGRRDRFVVPATGFYQRWQIDARDVIDKCDSDKAAGHKPCITAAYRFTLVISSISMQKRDFPNRVLKIGIWLAVKRKADSKSFSAFANSTRRDILLLTKSVVSYDMSMFSNLLLLLRFCNQNYSKIPLWLSIYAFYISINAFMLWKAVNFYYI